MSTENAIRSSDQLAVQFSRQRPARALIPVNYNHLGAHYELIPTEFPTQTYPKPKFRQGKRMICERSTSYPCFNQTRETPLYPPYYNYGTYNRDDPTRVYEGESHILTGKSIKTQIIPVY